MSEYARVYISMPRGFLRQVDRAADEEHLSRSALIREAVKLYMAMRPRGARSRFFAMSEALREDRQDLPEWELEERIDRAVEGVRSRLDA